jgi:hypothetical protein
MLTIELMSFVWSSAVKPFLSHKQISSEVGIKNIVFAGLHTPAPPKTDAMFI